MAALPVYQVEFIPLERRLSERRAAPVADALPSGIAADRRNPIGRRAEDRPSAPPKAP